MASRITAQQVLGELSGLASPSIKKVLLQHGAPEQKLYGVKIEDLKKLQKRIKQDHALALELFATGISDAMYLAGLIADPAAMKKSDLKLWAKQASWSMLREWTVPWVACESRFGPELAREWVKSKQESIATIGWATYCSMVSVLPDKQLDLQELECLLDRVQDEVHQAQNRVRYTMNVFVIAVGSYVVPLNTRAKDVARSIGPVRVAMGATACKVPLASAYIEKVERAGKLGVKRKHAIC